MLKDVQRQVRHPILCWMAATLDGVVESTEAVFESKFMLPWAFSEEAAAEKHMAQLQHNMWVIRSKTAVLSIITGGGKWVEITITADPLYQHLLLTAEKKFWRCVQTGETPRLFGVEPPRPRIEAVRTVDMSLSNSWAEFAAVYCRTRPAFSSTRRPRPSSRRSCRRTPRRLMATGSGPSARSQGRSASMSGRGGRPCTALANRSARSRRPSPRLSRARQSREVADRRHSIAGVHGRGGTDIPLCAPVERPRYRAQDPRAA